MSHTFCKPCFPPHQAVLSILQVGEVISWALQVLIPVFLLPFTCRCVFRCSEFHLHSNLRA